MKNKSNSEYFHGIFFIFPDELSVTYSEHVQTSTMESFKKIVNGS